MFQFLYHCSFVCQFFLHYYWYFYNSNQSSGGVLQKVCAKIFSKFIRKHLCYSLILNEVADLRSLTLLTKRFQHRCSLMNFANFPIPLSSKKKKKKKPSGGWFCINTRSVYCPTMTFCFFRKDVTYIFQLNMFLV